MSPIDNDQFSELLKDKLGTDWDRALLVFNNYSPALSFDVVNVLMHASDQHKVGEVLGLLEQHYEGYLKYQHPDIRGRVTDGFGINRTQALFVGICQKVLKLQPTNA